MPWRSSILPVCLALLLAAASAPAPASVSPDGPLTWHLPGEEVALAAQQGKPILYFVTADWCAPCHALESRVFSDPAKADRIGSWYVPVVVEDMRAETGTNNPEVAAVIERYRVQSIPTLVVALPDGTPVAAQAGYRGADNAWRWLQQQAGAAEKHLAK